ncbi:hypothetical protein M5K25_000277 [Dendrobium thyrsiflorum]|uniref:Uncharacterized protein n=1 Tax=Dendrobium thyrsiflorum TaxID=117978 RepID=A0ABD0VTJ6_DENTH
MEKARRRAFNTNDCRWRQSLALIANDQRRRRGSLNHVSVGFKPSDPPRFEMDGPDWARRSRNTTIQNTGVSRTSDRQKTSKLGRIGNLLQSVLGEVLCLHRGVVKKEVAVLCRVKEECCGSLPEKEECCGSLPEEGRVVLCRHQGVVKKDDLGDVQVNDEDLDMYGRVGERIQGDALRHSIMTNLWEAHMNVEGLQKMAGAVGREAYRVRAEYPSQRRWSPHPVPAAALPVAGRYNIAKAEAAAGRTSSGNNECEWRSRSDTKRKARTAKHAKRGPSGDAREAS